MQGHQGECCVCRFDLGIPAHSPFGKLYTCPRCGIVNVTMGMGEQGRDINRPERIAIYQKYDGAYDLTSPGLVREASDRHAKALVEMDSHKAEMSEELFRDLRATLIWKHERELRHLENAKRRELRPLKRQEREIRLRLVREGKMPHSGGRYL